MPSIEAPQIIIAAGTDEGIGKRIATIGRSIERDPDAFMQAFRELGGLATDRVIEVADMEHRIPTATRSPAKLIKEFLNNRYDRDSEFDEATEDALAADERYQELVDAVRSKKSVTVKTGQMSSQIRHNSEAEEARDELRRYRFGFYLGRVSAYKAAETKWQSAPAV